jgi:hypothetical protein
MYYANNLVRADEDTFGADKDGFQDGNLGVGLFPTELSASWYNDVTGELCDVVANMGGLTPTTGVYTQLRQAITNPIVKVTFGGGANFSTLTASQLLATDASKNAVSLPYSAAATASTLALRDGAAGLTVASLTCGNSAFNSDIIELNAYGTGNRYALLDFHSDDTYLDYGLRFGRQDTGANTNSILAHRGTGAIRIVTEDAGSIDLATSNTLRMSVAADGAITAHLLTASKLVGTNASKILESIDVTTTGQAASVLKTVGALTAGYAVVTDGSNQLASYPYATTAGNAHIVITDSSGYLVPQTFYTDSASGYAAQFINDGNNSNRYGIKIQCGVDTPANLDCDFVHFYDGDGTIVSRIQNSVSTPYALFTAPSDRRLKTNIEDSKVSALSLIDALRFREFDHRKDKPLAKRGHQALGLVAQEVQKVWPELVGSGPVEADSKEEYLSVSDIPAMYLAKAVQELIEVNKQMEARIQKLEAK